MCVPVSGLLVRPMLVEGKASVEETVFLISEETDDDILGVDMEVVPARVLFTVYLLLDTAETQEYNIE